jgi:hypothetical protein
MATLLGAPGQLAAQSPLEGIAGISVEGAGVEQALRLLRQVAGVSLV